MAASQGGADLPLPRRGRVRASRSPCFRALPRSTWCSTAEVGGAGWEGRWAGGTRERSERGKPGESECTLAWPSSVSDVHLIIQIKCSMWSKTDGGGRRGMPGDAFGTIREAVHMLLFDKTI